jgi:hypothetical protein
VLDSAVQLPGGARISGGRDTQRGPDASGLAAGMTIVAGILLGTGIGYLLGLLFGAVAILALCGAAGGIVLGFYTVYIRFIRIP